MLLRESIRLALLGAMLSAPLVWMTGCDDGGDPPPPEMDAGEGGNGGQPFGGVGGGQPFGGMGGVGGGGGEGGVGGAGGAVDMGPACDCPGNQTCDDAGACIESPDGCSEDIDCLEGRICEAGACADGCGGPEDCADPAAPLCFDGRCGDCADDDDCFGAATCVDNRCTAPDNCTASRECGAGQVCVEDDCTPGFNCAEMGCPEGFTCGDDGECRALPAGERCDDSAVCPLGEVCAGMPTICQPCFENEHCPGAQTCARDAAGNRCVEPVECADNADCLGNRSCEGGRCAAPRCDDDALTADNATAETAAVIDGDRSYPSLVNCGAEWIEFNLPENTIATVALRQLSRDADLRIEAFAANGVSLAQSDSNRPTESVVVGPFASARPVRLFIEQVDAPTVVEYRLDITFQGRADRCLDDAAEAGLGDDDAASARLIRGPQGGAFMPVSGRLCPADEDWMCFHMQARERLTINVEVTGPGTVTGRLLRDGDEEDDSTWTSEGGEPIVLPGAAGVVYCLALTADEPVAYVPRLQAVSPGVVTMCRNAEPVGLDGDNRLSETGRLSSDEDDDATSPSCAADRADAGEDAFNINIPESSLLIARLRGTAAGSLGDPVLSLRGDCESAETELACATGWFDPGAPALIEPNPAELRVPVQAGDYTIILDGIDPGNRAQYALEVSTRRLAARPDNDGCGDAEPIELAANGRTRLLANLDQARDDAAGCLGRGAPDVVYSLSLDAPARVRADVAAQGNEFAVGAYLVQRCGDPMPTACGFGFDEQVPAGEWLLVVDGASDNSRGRIEVDLLVEAFDEAPANNTCDTAVALQSEVAVEGDTRGAGDDVSLVDGNRCTGHDSRGGDLAYVADLQAGERYFVQAVPEGGWDLSLIVAEDCARADDTCVAGSDGALTESVVFTAAASGDHYIIVDGSAGEGGPFSLRYGPAECGRDADCPDDGRCGPDFTCVNE